MIERSLPPFACDEFDEILTTATQAKGVLARGTLLLRSRGLRSISAALRENAVELVAIAEAETSLGRTRLDGELVRTAFQLDYFAALIEAGDIGRDITESAEPGWPPAPRPGLTRRALPIGIVAVFSASNFPFAFSVAGGDTASALAAGCPVVVKAHSGHPRLSRRVAALARSALDSVGLPTGTLSLVEGRETGVRLVQDNRVDAVSFTGSTAGGRALFDLANGRRRPIPFFGELGSVNPVFITERAVAANGETIWADLMGSFTLGAGQFCTKPGLIFAPRSAHAPEKVAALLGTDMSWRMLDERIALGYAERVAALSARDDVDVVVAGSTEGVVSTPSLLRTRIADFIADPEGLSEECFGPATLIVEYEQEEDLSRAAKKFVGELTATIQALPDDRILKALLPALESRVGRLVWNQWPTGVSVATAMQHGGPYPASTSARDTSVGAAAVHRFERPVAYQNFPAELIAR